MKKLQIVIIIFIVLSGFIFFHVRKEDYRLAQELDSFDQNEDKNPDKFATLKYFFPFLKTDLQKQIDAGEKITFLLLGYGGEGHSGALLTDTMILGQMNFETAELTLMNLPRDLFVSGQKINALYASYSGDPSLVVSDLESLLDLQIDYYLTIDFEGFREAVDTLGGLEIYVEKTFDDDNYPRHDNDQIDPGVMSIHFDEGWELMNGERALQYARSRYSLEDGGDYNRSQRQQNVLKAFKDKVIETKDLKTLFSVAQTIQSHFTTNFPYVEALSINKYLEKNELIIKSKILSEDNYLYYSYNDAGSFILLPIDNDWSQIKDFFESETVEEENATE